MVSDVALILLGAGFAVSLLLSWGLLSVPGRLRVYAHPNARSFHDTSTPTSGGIAFVVPVTLYLVWLGLQPASVPLALAVGGLLLAGVGFWDDVREVSSRLRLVVQLLVSVAVAWTLLAEESEPSEHLLLMALVALALTWHVNLYNFMDGIDGLAGAQALVFVVGAQIVGLGLPGWPGDVLWLLAGSVLGFLVVNWPRAHIFMGDVGSYFLGLLTAALAVLLWRQGVLDLPASLILLAGFWFDASYTLIVRVFTGQPFTRPHKTHLYQKIAAKRGHLWTTVCYLLYAGLWLVPLAWLYTRSATAMSTWSLLWVLLAVTPMGIVAWRLRAGLPDRVNTA